MHAPPKILPCLLLHVLVAFTGLASAQQLLQESPLALVESPQDSSAPGQAPANLLPPLDLSGFGSFDAAATSNSFRLQDVVITGNSVIGSDDLQMIAAPYLDRELNYSALNNLRDEISLAYINRGFVTSGAQLSNQTLSDGVLSIDIVEGKLGNVDVSSGRFRTGTIRSRLGLSSGDIVNIEFMEQQIRQVQRDPRIARVNARLVPGSVAGQSDLLVDLEENPAIDIYSGYSNTSSPAVGSETAELSVAHNNLLGYGDSLALRAIDTEGLSVAEVSYQVPLNPRQGVLLLSARNSDSRVVDAAFAGLDIRGVSETVQLGFRQPHLLPNQDEIALSAVADFKRASSSLLGEGFSFSPGADDGETRVSAIRLAAEWHRRSISQVLSLRSQLSLGLNAFDATDNPGDTPDSQFVSLLVQGQWARQLQGSPWELRARLNLQVINSPVIGLEQFVLGGQSSVRGYRQNLLIRDSGLNASFEARYPLLQSDALQLTGALFSDIGHGRNVKRDGRPETLSALGVGLHATLWRRLNLSLEFGEALSDAEITGEPDRQDDGLHFSAGLRWAL